MMSYCHQCNRVIHFDFSVANKCWSKAIGDDGNPRARGYIYCINCFVKRCQTRGVKPEFVWFYSKDSPIELADIQARSDLLPKVVEALEKAWKWMKNERDISIAHIGEGVYQCHTCGYIENDLITSCPKPKCISNIIPTILTTAQALLSPASGRGDGADKGETI